MGAAAPLAPALTCRVCKPTKDCSYYMVVVMFMCKLEPDYQQAAAPRQALKHAAGSAPRDGCSNITLAAIIQKHSPSSHLQGVQTSPLMTATKSVATGVWKVLSMPMPTAMKNWKLASWLASCRGGKVGASCRPAGA